MSPGVFAGLCCFKQQSSACGMLLTMTQTAGGGGGPGKVIKRKCFRVLTLYQHSRNLYFAVLAVFRI